MPATRACWRWGSRSGSGTGLGATRVERSICGPTVGAGVKMTYGTTKCLDPMEIRHSKLIILWGTNTKLTNRHLWPTIEQARADGAKLVVLDPIRTMTAEAADWFIQPRPGTDIALMLAVMHVLIRDGLTDKQWVADHTIGFDELALHVDEWTPERAAATCGVAADDIEALAEMYGTIRPAVIRTLIGAEHHENGAMFFRTLACLPALVGAWQDRGGGLARSIGVWTASVVDGAALQRPELLGDRKPRWVNMSRLGETLTELTNPPIRGLMVWGCNPLVIAPNSEKIRAGMLRDDLFTVVHEQFVTDTARYADIVLPATTQIEAVDVVTPWGHLWLSWNEPAIEPCGESVSNSEMFRRLARAMGYTEPALYDDDMTVIRDSMPGVDIDELRRVGFMKVPYPEDGRPFGDGVFPTASGKVEFVSDALVAMGQPALPTFVPPGEGPGSVLAERYPLQLMTPKHHTRFLNSGYSDMPGHGGRGIRTVRRTVRGRCRQPGHHRGPVREGVQRSGFGRGSCSHHRSCATRSGVDPVGLVEPSSPRWHGRQLADQRHPHRMGRGRRLLRHPRRSQRWLIRQSNIRLSRHAGVALRNGRRADLRVPSHAPAAARCRWCDHRPARRHRRDSGSPRRRSTSAGVRRHQSAPPDLRQCRPAGGDRQRGCPAAQLGRRPQPVQAEARRSAGRARHHRSSRSTTKRSATWRCAQVATVARHGGSSPRCASPGAARCGGGRATAWSMSPSFPSCSARPGPRSPPKSPAFATCIPATLPASCVRCR